MKTSVVAATAAAAEEEHLFARLAVGTERQKPPAMTVAYRRNCLLATGRRSIRAPWRIRAR